MELRIITVGKISSWSREAYKHFLKMISRYARIEHIHLPTGGDLNKENPEVLKKKEAKKILEKIRGTPICLDVN
jgi:23S rRNA pseudoU1915 N3-methylase RlmH